MISALDKRAYSPIAQAQTAPPAAATQTDLFIAGEADQEGYELAAKMRLLRLAATTVGAKLLIGTAV